MDCDNGCEDGRLDCTDCQGTGIGQFGDPDTSKCSSCGGRGSVECYCVADEREYYEELKQEADKEFKREEKG